MTAKMVIQNYDHANNIVRREASMTLAAAASGTARWMMFQKAKLHAIHLRNEVAGTTAGAASGVTISVIGTATTSVGQATFSTGAAATTTTVEFSTTTINARGGVLLTKGADATMVVDAVIEYQVLPGALQSP